MSGAKARKRTDGRRVKVRGEANYHNPKMKRRMELAAERKAARMGAANDEPKAEPGDFDSDGAA